MGCSADVAVSNGESKEGGGSQIEEESQEGGVRESERARRVVLPSSRKVLLSSGAARTHASSHVACTGAPCS